MPRTTTCLLGRGTIEAAHNRLRDAFSGVLCRPPSISAGEGQWWRRADKSAVTFEMRDADASQYVERAQRKRGLTCVVMEVRAQGATWGENRCWMSWHESWIKSGTQKFEFHAAGMTFFFGPAGRDTKTQLIRAEWQVTEGSNVREGGQPHWHVDSDIAVPGIGVTSNAASELEELDPQGPRFEFSRFHLGMAGWEWHESEPKCWQARFDELKKLETWAIRSSRYCIRQIIAANGGEAPDLSP